LHLIDLVNCNIICEDNFVVRFNTFFVIKKGGRAELAKPPYAKRHKDGRIILTLLESKRCRHLEKSNHCGIYELRPHACSEFPMGSECCLFAREDVLKLHDGAVPTDAN
jgi:Fe-S-cluster containining protein